MNPKPPISAFAAVVAFIILLCLALSGCSALDRGFGVTYQTQRGDAITVNLGPTKGFTK